MNNSVRLQKYTKKMDLYSPRSTSMMDSSSEKVKLPALRAINKSVKYNDLSFATSRNLSKLRKEPDQPDNIEELAAHHSLVVVRKRYDNMGKTLHEYERTVDALQKQHDKLEAQKSLFQSSKDKGKSSVSSLQSDLKSIKLHLEETSIDKGIMLNMANRFKEDKVVYDLRKFNMEKDLAQTHKIKGIILKESQKHSEVNDRAQKVKSKLLTHLQVERRERDSHVRNVSAMVSQKQDMVTGTGVRKLQMQEVALKTLQDKSNEQKNWYKVHLCHRFVERLLRDKMNREMHKFNVVEVAFKNVKTSTGVSNADDLVRKFLSKESTYGELLGKITENQRTIADLKGEGEELRKESRKLKAENEQLNSNKIETQDLSKEEKQLRSMSGRSLKCHTILQKMDSWLNRNLKKFGLSNDNAQDSFDQTITTSSEMVYRFRVYLQTLDKGIQDFQQIEELPHDMESVKNAKNLRVNLDESTRFYQQNDKRPLNEEEEGDYINGQRSQVLRNNDKFMKDIKRKYQEIKKALIEAQPKKREVIAGKVAAPPVEVEA